MTVSSSILFNLPLIRFRSLSLLSSSRLPLSSLRSISISISPRKFRAFSTMTTTDAKDAGMDDVQRRLMFEDECILVDETDRVVGSLSLLSSSRLPLSSLRSVSISPRKFRAFSTMTTTDAKDAGMDDVQRRLMFEDECILVDETDLVVGFDTKYNSEEERIKKCRGRVFALRDEPEVCRVWLPNCDSPGLAMARAFGDFCLKDFGLISVPEVSFRRLTDKDEFIVLATDGIWDVLSNEEVVKIVASAPSRSSAARALVETAVRAWRHKYPTSKVDDCAAVCLYLNSNGSNAISTASSFSKLEDEDEIDDGSGPSGGLGRSSTVRTGKEIALDESEAEKLIKEEDTEHGTEYSALEGVARVNTLLNLPRFVPGK
ncbi:hypothetical protein F2Q68_00033285 [Brassica cretica]|uniref:PPM-type phosphatase domain-containing protein n=1 Tax=Brassica cretica TaxID=69181 RepID=A0A8S9GBM4_BRACR|nr:hypothetical protein F2Q68_00033285 [Brassica cretica]